MQTKTNITNATTQFPSRRTTTARHPDRQQHAVVISAFALLLLYLVSAATLATAQQPDISRLEWNSSAIDRIVNSDQTPPSQANQQETRHDEHVVPTAFERAPERVERLGRQETWDTNDLANIRSAADAIPTGTEHRMNFMQREQSAQASPTKADGTPEKQLIGPMVAKIGMNLAIVLFIGTGVVVLAKQWVAPQAETKPSGPDSSLLVKEVLILDNKSKLQVIQWQSTHVLVASDSQGIRSIVPLQPSFSQTMESFETETATVLDRPERIPTRAPAQPPREIQTPPSNNQTAARNAPQKNEAPNAIDDRLIQMLLDSANRSKPAKGYRAEGAA